MAKSMVAQINDILDDIHTVLQDDYEGAAKEISRECVQRLKAVKWKTNTGKNFCNLLAQGLSLPEGANFSSLKDFSASAFSVGCPGGCR